MHNQSESFISIRLDVLLNFVEEPRVLHDAGVVQTLEELGIGDLAVELLPDVGGRAPLPDLLVNLLSESHANNIMDFIHF
jgi:hypothetical protein